MYRGSSNAGGGKASSAEDRASCPSDARQAQEAGLRYVTDSEPGITRHKAGRGFSYRTPDGETIRDGDERQRIEDIVIPPAWTEVWICPDPRGHLQATGRDDAGRKQYIYHDKWLTQRSRHKYASLISFGESLPRIRRRVDRDLEADRLSRAQVLAAVVRTLDITLARIGSQQYTKAHGSFGLTTLCRKHTDVNGQSVMLEYKGKSHQPRQLEVDDPRIVRLIRQCHELPGHCLFKYRDQRGERHKVDSADVNAYLHDVTDCDITSKDFRTWGGTVFVASTLALEEPATTKAKRKKQIVAAVKAAAKRLGNRPATCRKYYLHPIIIEHFQAGTLSDVMNARPQPDKTPPRHGLSAEERVVLDLLRQGEAA